ncbi:hypothetical protein QBC41DRAFT_108124 [Cercophora samala]|uniref:Uncharacterized protein n=1 Tax=Cercophora samala TaxID=330535 RepID=A0AA39ZEH7_9PEZI|nr:hypothetical protein QBC41DRAFT_108124 [Cercophora samala]
MEAYRKQQQAATILLPGERGRSHRGIILPCRLFEMQVSSGRVVDDEGQQPRTSNRRNHFLDWRAQPALGGRDRGLAWPEATVGFHEQGKHQGVTPATQPLDERGVTARVYWWLTNQDTSRGTARPTESDFLKHNTRTHKPHSQDRAPVVSVAIHLQVPFYAASTGIPVIYLILYHCGIRCLLLDVCPELSVTFEFETRHTPACVCDCTCACDCDKSNRVFFATLRRPLSSFFCHFQAATF